MMNRRSLMGSTFTVGISLAVSGAVSGCQADKTGVKSKRSLDFTTPEDNLFGLMKLMGDVSGKRSYYFQPGRVFVHRDGELPKHMLNYTGATVREIRPAGNGDFISRYSGWQLFRDPVTDAVIDEWTNPSLGTSHKVEHFAFENRKQTFSTSGLERPKGYTGDFSWFNREFILPWQIIQDDVWAPYEQFSRYTNRAGHARYENAIHTYHGKLSDLQNEDLSSAPSSIASQSQSPYYPWMGYGEMDGHMISSSLGRKSDRIDLYPESFMADMDKYYPNAFDVVFDWES